MLKLTEDTSQWNTVTHLIEWLNKENFTPKPKILDIGAHDGKRLSNSYPFIVENEYYGILVEPNPVSFADIRRNILGPLGTAYEAWNFGLSDKTTENVLFLRDNDPTLGSLHLEAKDRVDVQLVDFVEFAYKVNLDDIGIMSIDTEGHDIVVLNRMIEFTDVRPQIIITESWPWNVDANQFKDKILTSAGYEKFLNVEENDFYIIK